LIVGNDSRSFVHSQIDIEHFGSPSTQEESLSDTIMIAHVDPAVKVASLVSIPRDTFVTIPGCNVTVKINATFNSAYSCSGKHGGPQMLVDTINANFGVPINHYIEVNFVAFRQIVDVIGHVSLYFPAPAKDKESGLFIPHPGCVQLDGIMALNYARSRYYQWQDSSGNWVSDPRSDFGRIARQQYFIRTLMAAAIHAGASNPLTATALVSKIVPHLTVDKNFSVDDLNRLIRSFHSLEPGTVQMLTVPTSREFLGGQDGLRLDQPGAEQMFAMLRGFSTPAPKLDPSKATVDVENGGAAAGQAAAALNAFASVGFHRGTAGNATTPVAVTEVRATRANAGYGLLVVHYLGGVGKLVEVPDTGSAQVIVVLGPDFRGVVKPAATTPTSTPSTTPQPATTTTTLPPNPGTPPAGATNVGHQVIGCA
jgi:LCP family protein required for cell wall assembly